MPTSWTITRHNRDGGPGADDAVPGSARAEPELDAARPVARAAHRVEHLVEGDDDDVEGAQAFGHARMAVRTVDISASCVAPSLACSDMPW